MHQIYPDAGLLFLLARFAALGFHYHLFNNNVTVDRSKVLGDFTEETLHSYAPVTVTGADFTSGGVTAHIGSIVAAPISFTPAGGNWTIYGYYVTDTSDALLLFAGDLDGAPVTVLDGVPLLITPILGDFSKYSS